MQVDAECKSCNRALHKLCPNPLSKGTPSALHPIQFYFTDPPHPKKRRTRGRGVATGRFQVWFHFPFMEIWKKGGPEKGKSGDPLGPDFLAVPRPLGAVPGVREAGCWFTAPAASPGVAASPLGASTRHVGRGGELRSVDLRLVGCLRTILGGNEPFGLFQANPLGK